MNTVLGGDRYLGPLRVAQDPVGQTVCFELATRRFFIHVLGVRAYPAKWAATLSPSVRQWRHPAATQSPNRCNIVSGSLKRARNARRISPESLLIVISLKLTQWLQNQSIIFGYLVADATHV